MLKPSQSARGRRTAPAHREARTCTTKHTRFFPALDFRPISVDQTTSAQRQTRFPPTSISSNQQGLLTTNQKHPLTTNQGRSVPTNQQQASTPNQPPPKSSNKNSPPPTLSHSQPISAQYQKITAEQLQQNSPPPNTLHFQPISARSQPTTAEQLRQDAPPQHFKPSSYSQELFTRNDLLGKPWSRVSFPLLPLPGTCPHYHRA